MLHPKKFHTSIFTQTPFVKSGKLLQEACSPKMNNGEKCIRLSCIIAKSGNVSNFNYHLTLTSSAHCPKQ